MGTHPIFESDFDCLTDLIRTTIHNGPYLSHRRWRLQVLALSDVLQACPAQAHQDGDQGREEGQRRCCRKAGRWRQERRCPPGHFRQAAQVLPNSVGPPQDQGSRPEALLPARPLTALVNHAWYRLDPSRRCPPWQARCFLEATRVWSSPRHWPIQGQHASAISDLTPSAREPCAVTVTQIQNGPCDFGSSYQTITGRCNNIKSPNWGAANIPFSRLASPKYGPDSTTPRGVSDELPNVRVVATAFPEKDNPDGRVSSMIMQFGQFLDHDISATSFPEKRCCLNPGRPECFNINVPVSDPFYQQRHNLSSTCIDFARSRPACGQSSREQVNTITAFIDASNVYGSDDETAQILRSNIGGRLVENEQESGHLPTKDQLRRPSDHLDDRQDFVAGDLRVNEQPFLTSMHVLFLREHNRLANILQKQLNTENDELLYQSARKLVIIEMQNIVYHEFLPTLLGRRFMEKYKLDLAGDSKYNPNANPSVLNSFATAAFRFGHSMINSLFKVIFTNQEIFWRLSDLFNGKKFNGKHLLDIEPMILGLLNQNAQKVDGSFANELKNHLFTEHSPKRQMHFGGDLVARNIQRGRDHGIPDYNTFRRICNLQPISSFQQKPLEMSRDVWATFQALYTSVDDIDLYPAAIAESPVDSDAILGPTFSCLIGLQFHNLKYGDRYFFTHHRPNLNYLKRFMAEMEHRTLSDVICDNTYIDKVQQNALQSPHPVTNPLKRCRKRSENRDASNVPVDLNAVKDNSDKKAVNN